MMMMMMMMIMIIIIIITMHDRIERKENLMSKNNRDKEGWAIRVKED